MIIKRGFMNLIDMATSGLSALKTKGEIMTWYHRPHSQTITHMAIYLRLLSVASESNPCPTIAVSVTGWQWRIRMILTFLVRSHTLRQ